MPLLSREVLLNCLVYVIRPAVAFCLKHSLKLQDLVEAAKHAFVLQAQTEVEARGKRPNVSKVSIITGIHRRDVDRLFDGKLSYQYSKDVATRVIATWLHDKRFRDRDGKPKLLSYRGEGGSFSELVRTVSQDVNPASVKFDLERVGAVVETAAGELCLLAGSYVPKGDVQGGFTLLAKDGHDMMMAIGENVLEERDPPHLHARTEYDRVRLSELDAVQRQLLHEGHLFHRRVRDILSGVDLDTAPARPGEDLSAGTVRVVVSSFGFVELGGSAPLGDSAPEAKKTGRSRKLKKVD